VVAALFEATSYFFLTDEGYEAGKQMFGICFLNPDFAEVFVDEF
jgi:hypothetical protein